MWRDIIELTENVSVLINVKKKTITGALTAQLPAMSVPINHT